MKMFVESICAGTYPDNTTKQVYEYYDYLANLTSNWACTGTNNVSKSSTVMYPHNMYALSIN